MTGGTIREMSAPRRNIECKASDPDPSGSLAVCRTLGAQDHGEIRQRDTYFTVPRGGLKLREEQPGRPHLIQFERASEPQQRESRYCIAEVRTQVQARWGREAAQRRTPRTRPHMIAAERIQCEGERCERGRRAGVRGDLRAVRARDGRQLRG
jgi:hypothetical protein